MTTPDATSTGIMVKSRIFPLAFILLLFKTIVTIDGTPALTPWGEHFFPGPAGQHEVQVAFKYLFGPMGANRVTVNVVEGQVTRVNYRSPFLIFMKGKISVA